MENGHGAICHCNIFLDDTIHSFSGSGVPFHFSRGDLYLMCFSSDSAVMFGTKNITDPSLSFLVNLRGPLIQSIF